MRISSDVKIPENAHRHRQAARPRSVAGGRWISSRSLIPRSGLLRNGLHHPKERTAIPQDVAELLREADKLGEQP